MLYHRGTRGSYDLWAEQVGDEGYSWDNMLPHFKRSMHFSPPNVAARGAGNDTPSYDLSAWSPAGGPLQVSYPNFVMPFSPYGLSALEASGFEGGLTFESGDLIGAGYIVGGAIIYYLPCSREVLTGAIIALHFRGTTKD